MSRPRRDLPLFDYLLGKLAMAAAGLLARRARRRGDRHEELHCTLMVVLGQSTHDHDGPRCFSGDVLSTLNNIRRQSKPAS